MSRLNVNVAQLPTASQALRPRRRLQMLQRSLQWQGCEWLQSCCVRPDKIPTIKCRLIRLSEQIAVVAATEHEQLRTGRGQTYSEEALHSREQHCPTCHFCLTVGTLLSKSSQGARSPGSRPPLGTVRSQPHMHDLKHACPSHR